jgi:SAM-dependent methyltransferase
MFGRKKRISRDELHIKNGKESFTIKLAEIDKHQFNDGDELYLSEKIDITITPDSCKNVRAEDGLTHRLPPKWKNSKFKSFVLPEHLVLLTGAGTETLDEIGKAHIDNYKKFLGIDDEMHIVEIGSGIGRDAFQLIEEFPNVHYLGIDVTRDSVNWCINHITSLHSNFQFLHFDAYHELYNPLGLKNTSDFLIPVKTASIDRIFLGSVFTHLFEEDIRHYMKEISRILKPDGLAYATFFLYSEEIIAAARKTRRSHNGLTFEFQHSPGCFVSDPNFHTGSVAYTDELMRSMISESGLSLSREYLKGWWSGYFEECEDGQEVAILTPSVELNSK